MPDTLTYKNREYVWLPADYEHPAWDRRYGNLTIELWHAKNRRQRVGDTDRSTNMECDTYAVEEQPPEPGWLFRQFMLISMTDPEQEEPYVVRIGRYKSCTCKAGRCKRDCKHVDCIADMIAEGTLPPEYDLPPVIAEAARYAAESHAAGPGPAPGDYDDPDVPF